MAQYLVTGAAGFIGSNIVEELVRRGESVRALDNLATGRITNLDAFREDIEFVQGDINDDALLTRTMQGVDYVLHQAALPSVPRSVEDPLSAHEANATGTLKVLLAAREAGVKRVVYASSSSVYGDSPTLPKHEEMPTAPMSPYAVNKLTGEDYCKVFAKVYGLPTVALRYFNVFGPRQDPKSQYAAAIPGIASKMMRGEPPTIYGDGEQTRDFTYVQNVVNANLLACERNEAVGLAMNVACGERISLLQLVALLNEVLGTSLEPEFAPTRAGDVKHSLADIGLAERTLGYRVEVGFKEGLERTVEALRNAGT
ncbi:MAG: SDR family oxidoreductase [Chloroflexota bacterium]|nr:SDR family oxidoreductase [Chloroflexota bacterium]MDQ5864613.1 SDR family oxidoreductase [Chloroflexota bacterium]